MNLLDIIRDLRRHLQENGRKIRAPISNPVRCRVNHDGIVHCGSVES